MNDLQQFSQAILSGAQQAAPSSYLPDIANAMRGSFNAAAVNRAGKAQGAVASQMAEDEEKRRQAALKAAQDRIDPSKYQRIRKNDGGFAFYDPSGKEIDIDTFSKATGSRRSDILKDSDNPLDQQFLDDYAKMNEVNQAIWRNDSTAILGYQLAFPELFKNGNPTPEQVNRLLLEKYPHIFGMGNYQKSLSNLGKPVFAMSDAYNAMALGSSTQSSKNTGSAKTSSKWVAN